MPPGDGGFRPSVKCSTYIGNRCCDYGTIKDAYFGFWSTGTAVAPNSGILIGCRSMCLRGRSLVNSFF